jgi:hypothetical protein
VSADTLVVATPRVVDVSGMQPDFARQEPAVWGRITGGYDHRSRNEPRAGPGLDDVLAIGALRDAAHSFRNVRKPGALEGLSRDLVDVRAVETTRYKIRRICSRSKPAYEMASVIGEETHHAGARVEQVLVVARAVRGASAELVWLKEREREVWSYAPSQLRCDRNAAKAAPDDGNIHLDHAA